MNSECLNKINKISQINASDFDFFLLYAEANNLCFFLKSELADKHMKDESLNKYTKNLVPEDTKFTLRNTSKRESNQQILQSSASLYILFCIFIQELIVHMFVSKFRL